MTFKKSAENLKTREKKSRAWELDFLRGLSILMVVWDHTIFDFYYLFGSTWKASGVNWLADMAEFGKEYLNGGLRHFWWPVFVFIFFFVSGICTAFSKNNFFRGLKLAAAAILVTAVTFAIERFAQIEGVLIIFGVLHCLAACILIFSLIEFIIKLINRKGNWAVLPVVAGALAVVLLVLDKLYNVPFNDASSAYSVVETDSFVAGFFVFTAEVWAMTADYFPLLPFFGFFMLGAAIGNVLYRNKKSLLPKLDGKWHYFFTVPGRHSLTVYLAIQVVAVGVLGLITYFATGSFGF